MAGRVDDDGEDDGRMVDASSEKDGGDGGVGGGAVLRSFAVEQSEMEEVPLEKNSASASNSIRGRKAASSSSAPD